MQSQLVLTAILLVPFCGHLGGQGIIVSHVRLIAETQDGEQLPSVDIQIVDLRSKHDYGELFRDGILERLPFGYYDLKVSAPGFRDYRRRLAVFDRDLVVRVTMQISTESTGALPVRGVLVPVPDSKRKTWVLLFPLAGSPDDILEGLVDQDGRFSLSVFGGPYLVMVMQGEQVLYCKKIYVGHDTRPLEIVLPQQSQSKGVLK